MVFFQFEDFTLHVDGDLARQISTGHGGGNFGDVTDLAGKVTGHEVYVIC